MRWRTGSAGYHVLARILQRPDHAHPHRPALAGQRRDGRLSPLAQVAFGLVGGQERQLIDQHDDERVPGRGGEGAGEAADCPARSCISATAASSSSTMAAAWQAYRWNRARPNDSSIRLGSRATPAPTRRDGGQQRPDQRRDHDPFPDPVAPAISTCVAASRSRHGEPSSHRPIGSPARSTSPVMGRAPIGSARVSARTSSSTTTPGAALRMRHSRAPNACARFSARASKSVGACPAPAQPVPGRPPRPGAPGPAREASAARDNPGQGPPESWRPSTGAGKTSTPASPAPAPPRTGRTRPPAGHAARPARRLQERLGPRRRASPCRARSPPLVRLPRRRRDGSGRTTVPASSTGRAGRP